MKTSTQADTNWINQISISSDYQSIYTCSSDTLVKVWRPNAQQNDKAATLGSHGDYVKCLTAPKDTNAWIATGGLDREIILWDTAGNGERMRINETSVDGGMKQSVYALAAGPNMLCSGGIEKVIRLWDTRTAQRITKFVGHTDNVRAILCSDDGKTFVSASSDSTIKIWDSTAGRCLHTMTFHSDPVWALHSEHPDLAVFYAGDRSGLVSKSDLRHLGGDKMETIALCKEKSSINSLALLGDRLFTATSSSSIHRWRDTETVPTDPFADPENLQASLSRIETHSSGVSKQKALNGNARRVSTYSAASVVSLGLDTERRSSVESLLPHREAPEDVIQGQTGLIAHQMLNDRIHVLTRNTAGDVSLWDIAQCQKVKEYGKVDMEEIEDTLQSSLAIPSWCSVNTRVGALTVEMDPRNLLDAETYFDTVLDRNALDFDTRNRKVNIGKWLLSGLFKGLADAETLRDTIECARLRKRRPSKLDLGELTMNNGGGLETPRPSANGARTSIMHTPGSSVGLATPMPTYNGKPGHTRQLSQAEPTTPVAGDYFADSHGKDKSEKDSEPTTPGGLKTPGGGSFMKGMKWMRGSKSAKSPAAEKVATKDLPPPAAVLKPAPIDLPPTTFKEVVDRQRLRFIDEEKEGSAGRESWIVPLEPMPPLTVPKQVELGIADFKPGEGEAKDIYRGTVGGLTSELTKVASILPAWLAQILLLNETPQGMHNAEQAKLYFSFAPLPGSKLGDPFNQANAPMRLGAARSLRVRKALTYISQRLDKAVLEQEGQGGNEEDWLEIRVNGTPVDPDWTLFMVRRHLWKQGGDMRLEYQLKREASAS